MKKATKFKLILVTMGIINGMIYALIVLCFWSKTEISEHLFIYFGAGFVWVSIASIISLWLLINFGENTDDQE